MKPNLTDRLKELGIDPEYLAKNNLIPNPRLKGGFHVCKDGRRGNILVTSIPQTEWVFEGLVQVVGGLVILIDRDVAVDWKIPLK